MQSQIDEMASLNLGKDLELNVLNTSDVDKVQHYPLLYLPS